MVTSGPSRWRMIARGLIRRCPHCGEHGAFFVTWFGKQDECRGCKLVWQRNSEGFMLGALAMNIVITGAANATARRHRRDDRDMMTET